MILTKSVNVKVITNHIEKYRKLGYECIVGDIIDIKIEDLTLGSNSIITAQCDYCNNKKSVSYKEYNRNKSLGDMYSCSRKCSVSKSIKSNLEKYGVENIFQSEKIKDKIKDINLDKYNVEHYSQTKEYKEKVKTTHLDKYGKYYRNTDDYKESYKKTCLDKYGVEHFSKTSEYKEKFKTTSLEKYGVEHYNKTDEYNKKCKSTSMEKYGVEHHTKSETYHSNTKIGKDINYINYINYGISLFKCDKGHTFDIYIDNYIARDKKRIPLCTVCNPIGDSKSIKENEIFEYIKSIYKGEIITSYRDKLEIDIYLPELNLGFEFNGLYWHSNKFKEKNYHSNKTNYFKDNGIRIIHIWEDDWTFKTDIVKSQISNLLKNNTKKIFARKCIIKEVDTKIARQFLDDHHIQSKVNSTIKLGLYFEDELVSIMTFDTFEGRKKMEEGGYNLSRFCNKINTNVVGGASKLLKNFLNTYNPTRIVSYADKDWSIGSLYYILGFENIGDNDPDYKYIVENKRVHKSRYKKSKLKTELTEEKATEKLGILKIYDCGKLKFEKII